MNQSGVHPGQVGRGRTHADTACWFDLHEPNQASKNQDTHNPEIPVSIYIKCKYSYILCNNIGDGNIECSHIHFFVAYPLVLKGDIFFSTTAEVISGNHVKHRRCCNNVKQNVGC